METKIAKAQDNKYNCENAILNAIQKLDGKHI